MLSAPGGHQSFFIRFNSLLDTEPPETSLKQTKYMIYCKCQLDMIRFPYVSIAFWRRDLQKYNRNKGKNHVRLAPARHQLIFRTFQWSFGDEACRNAIETNENMTYGMCPLEMHRFSCVSIVFWTRSLQKHH